MIKNKKKLVAVEMPEFLEDIKNMPQELKDKVDKAVEFADKFQQWLEENCRENGGYWYFKKDGKMSVDKCPHYQLEDLKVIFESQVKS